MTEKAFSRLARLVLVAMLVGIVAVAAPAPVAAGEIRCFSETGYCTQGAFYDFWRTHGAVAILGFPVGPAVADGNGLLVQYYERAVLEWHEGQSAAYLVQVTRLGDVRLGNSPERSTPPGACDAGACQSFPETNHTVSGPFLAFWTTAGGLAVFGLPLTEAFTEVQGDSGPRQVQYFERARFELDPGTGSILLGRLGAEAWATRTDLQGAAAVTVPDYPIPVPSRPVRLVIPSLNVDTAIESVGLDAAGNMDVPSGPVTVAWYAFGARPGEAGSAVMAGHVDYHNYGPAVFWRLSELAPGDVIWVTDEAGPRRRFRVYEVSAYRTFDAPLERIFGRNNEANLNLITCTGSFNGATREYDRRLVVYAQLDGIAW